MEHLSDYGQDRELIKQFLKDFTHVNQDGQAVPKYDDILTSIANREAVHLYLDLADMEHFNSDLASKITRNTIRYTQVFYEALDEILPSYKTKEHVNKDIMDVFIEQRLFIADRNLRAQQMTGNVPTGSQSATAEMGSADIEGRYPPDLVRRVEISFKPSTFTHTPLREILSKDIGHLVTVRGLVTRVSDVKPQITIATYTCDQCGCESFQPINIVHSSDYTPLFVCSSAACKASKAPGTLTHQIRGSKFVKSQEIRLQELTDEVPTGNIPRAIKLIVHGELTRQCNPGDIVSVTGVFLSVERATFRMRSGGLSAETFIEAHYISLMSKSESSELNIEPMTNQEAQELIASGENFLNRLSSSIAPEIFGHSQLKKALLLLLVGGVDKTTQGMKTRGNINICLMGDPGVAKSQLLSFIDRLAPRSQYTSGRGSSGVGLTAAVIKDPITNEMLLEGGALVLADQGICCIDEFDKMMDADRTAIHEVMEQQSVSIAKAGIMTTLNARVSILAAANPAYGRYNVQRSITDNLQLPPALLSRFDLLWLIKDQPSKQRDLDLASHVTHIHKDPNIEVPCEYDAIDMKVMRRYINLCKTKDPSIPEHLLEKYVDIYLSIRPQRGTDRDRLHDGEDDALFTSPRSLLAIVRLSTALARLRLSDEVELGDIEEAVRLYKCSRESLEGPRNEAAHLDQEVLRLIIKLTASAPMRKVSKETLKLKAEELGLAEDQVARALTKLCDQDSIVIEGNDVIKC